MVRSFALLLCGPLLSASPTHVVGQADASRHPGNSEQVRALNSEWKNYRWGPVLGRRAVPSLVDGGGFFFRRAEALHQNHPSASQARNVQLLTYRQLIAM